MSRSIISHRVSLPRALSKLGFTSRSKALEDISTGVVAVNGKPEFDAKRRIDLMKDKVTVNGKGPPQQTLKYLILNKPVGFVTTSSDEKGRQTIYDVAGARAKGLIPVGRLDKDTSGLLLMTNDHRLADFLTNPSSNIEKTYLVHVGWPLQKRDLERLARGIEITVDGKPYVTKPARARMIAPTTAEVTITEGKNRQIRKMMEASGYVVIGLQRISLGPVSLGSLKLGKSRELSRTETEDLYALMQSKHFTARRKRSRSSRRPVTS